MGRKRGEKPEAPAGPPPTWKNDLHRMRDGEVDYWMIPSRPYLLEQGFIRIVRDPDTGLWVGDQITPAGVEALA